MTLDRFALAALALVASALAPDAQSESRPRLERSTPVKHMAYDWANRKVVHRGVPQKRFVANFCYVDTDTVGYFTTVSPGTEFIDWGIMGGTATTKCSGLSDIVSGFSFAYGTSTPDTSVGGPGASLTVSFYTNFNGFCADSGNAPVATFAFTGMPGFSGSSTGMGAAYAFNVDLSGGFEFCLPDGRFGYGYAGDGYTGPVLVETSESGPDPCTGNVNYYDIWLPDTSGVCLGSFCIGCSVPALSAWYGQIARADLAGSPAAVALRTAAPNAPGSLVCTAPQLAGTCTLTAADPSGHAVAIAFAFDTPVSLLLGGGQRLLCIDLGGYGELLTGSGLVLSPTGPSAWSSGPLPVPKNLDLCGFSLCVQTIFAFGVLPFSLSSACDLTLGG